MNPHLPAQKENDQNSMEYLSYFKYNRLNQLEIVLPVSLYPKNMPFDILVQK